MTTAADDARIRVMQGFTAAVAERGYAATTIADIVAAARVSKRTFYEHFPDKEACLLATYRASADRLERMLREAGRQTGDGWRERVHALVTAYLEALDAVGPASRTVLVEVQAAGPRAFRMRSETQDRFAALFVELVESDPALPPLTPALAIALVGGINELLLHVADPYTRDGEPFTSLVDTVAEFASAVIGRGNSTLHPGNGGGSVPAKRS
ncbi:MULTISPECIES: TetR/AcrR family transcriptional regulator [Catenuloplanes]|uniref:AcrR family transcriptional regulator n=1 Tax=Catenuloplanes niger TaxID=587534 RepID=A0AAE4CUM8_9ACTN|nr:TetR/AcrR family transcriptional regulator [Catenuloplanes niger]MDR7324567.1 AcrR family transcriptional regulator [Catenuloplanes niger]